jgi:hypothetical protein
MVEPAMFYAFSSSKRQAYGFVRKLFSFYASICGIAYEGGFLPHNILTQNNRSGHGCSNDFQFQR